MRNLKKILALVLALMMVLSVMVTASAAFEDADSINPAYEQAVEVMTAAGILNGIPVGEDKYEFAPTQVLTRAEASKLIAYVVNGPAAAGIAKCETVFDDVAATNWASGFIALCSDLEIILGDGTGNFNPNADVTIEQYAKMLLVALGVEGNYTGAKWYVAVRNNAVANKLMTGMTGYTWTAGLTREEACQMTFNAMVAGSTVTYSEAGYKVSGTGITTRLFTSASEAYFYQQAQITAGVDDAKVEYVDSVPTATGLMAKYGITPNYTDTDKYGAPAVSYTFSQLTADTKDDVKLYYPAAESEIITEELTAPEVATLLKGYWVVDKEYTVEGTAEEWWVGTGCDVVYVDGAAKTNIGVSGTAQTLSSAIAALTDDNAVVRVYATEGKITNIVVTNTVVDTVKEVIEADAEKEIKAAIVLTKGGKVETEGYIVGEVVTYTKCGSKVENLTKADYIMGTLTSYNSKNQSYTINGTDYTLDGVVLTNVAAMFAEAHVFYIGANNTIISVAEELPSADAPSTPVAPTVPTDYAIIDAVAAKVVTGTVAGDLWTNDVQVVTDVLVQVKAYTTDGSYGVYDLEVTKAAADIKNPAGKVLVAKDAWYIVVGGTYHTLTVAVDTDGNDLANEVKGILQGTKADLAYAVYPYAAEDGVITLYSMMTSLSGAETESGDVVRLMAANTTISASSMTIVSTIAQDILINADTTYLLKYDPDTTKANDEYYANTTTLAGTVIDGDKVMVVANVAVTKDKDGNVTDRVYTAKYVFAYADTYNAGEAPEVPVGTEMVYVDASDYTLTEMSKDGNTYIYNVVKTDGTTAQLKYVGTSALAADASGIYLLKTDGSLGTKVAGQTAATVNAISGTTVKLDSTYKTINDSTTVVGEIEVGAKVLYILDSTNTNLVKLVYVTKAADAE